MAEFHLALISLLNMKMYRVYLLSFYQKEICNPLLRILMENSRVLSKIYGNSSGLWQDLRKKRRIT